MQRLLVLLVLQLELQPVEQQLQASLYLDPQQVQQPQQERLLVSLPPQQAQTPRTPVLGLVHHLALYLMAPQKWQLCLGQQRQLCLG